MHDVELITGREVAQITGKSMATVARWRREGLLTESGRNWRGWPLYRKEDAEVLEALDVTPVAVAEVGGSRFSVV